MDWDSTAERVALVIREHQPTTGMAVTMGTTCKCGYWTGDEEPGRNRPVGFQGLQWHQAVMVSKKIDWVEWEDD